MCPSWSGLRSDVILNIAYRLHSRIDRLCFRGVCRCWRDVVPLPPSPPQLNRTLPGSLHLVESTFFCIQPFNQISDTSNCWLINVEETEEHGKVRLKHPLHESHKYLSPHVPESLNLLDYRVSEVTTIYGLRSLCNPKIPVLEYESIAVCYECAVFAVMAVHSAGHLSIWRMGDEE